VSIVLGGSVEYAPIENCRCGGREPGERGGSDLADEGTFTSWILIPDPGDCGIGGVCSPGDVRWCVSEGGAEGREACAWSLVCPSESASSEAGVSISVLTRGDRFNFARAQDLRFAAIGRFQRTIITVSSIIPAHTGPVASQKSRLDMGALSKSFMLFMPKY